MWFGDIHGPKPYKFIGFGDIHGPSPYKFIGFGWALISQNTGSAGSIGPQYALKRVGGGARSPCSVTIRLGN